MNAAVRGRLIGGLLMACGFGLIGFFDDYIKVVKRGTSASPSGRSSCSSSSWPGRTCTRCI